MSATQVQCHGCKKAFTPNGYSQHIFKTTRAVCRALHTGLLLAPRSQHSINAAMPISSTWDPHDEPTNNMDIPADHVAHNPSAQPELNSRAEFTTMGMEDGNAPFHVPMTPLTYVHPRK
jgi:hypothetical protein